MKKFLCIGLCALCFLITGCSAKRIKDTTVEQMKEKMDQKESFAIVFTQPNCGYCNKFKKMLDTYLPDHDVTLYEVSLNRDVMSEDEFNAMLEDIRVYFPEMNGTPDLYYVKDGKIEDHFDADAVDLGEEKNFNDWVDKHQLNKDIDYTKETEK